LFLFLIFYVISQKPKFSFHHCIIQACDVPLSREDNEKWDALHASKLAYMKGSKTGRLLRYDPKTEEVDLLATGMYFANGISVDKDENYLIITETFQAQVRKYYLKGEKMGQLDILLDRLPGLPDGVDCSHDKETCYIVLPNRKCY